MSNPSNQFETLTPEEFLEKWGTYLQGKVDKRGGTVAPEGSNQRLAASWCNLVDDLMLAVLNGSIGNAGGQEIVDNTADPLFVASRPVGGFQDFTIDIPTQYNTLELLWYSVTRRDTSFPSSVNVELFSRVARRPNDRIFYEEFPGDSALPSGSDFAGARGKLLNDAYANPLDPGATPGTLRIYGRMHYVSGVNPVEVQFAYAVRAFNTDFTPIPEQITSTPE